MKLGSRVRDIITGFEGIADSRTEYQNGCVSIGVQPLELNKEGEPGDIVYFDEQRLGPGSKATKGGPGGHPPQRSTPPSR